MSFDRKFQERSPEGSAGGGNLFIKLGDKESITGVLRGDILEGWTHWSADESTYYACPGRDSCALCDQKVKSGYRFKSNFIVSENGAYVAKILEMPQMVYKGIQAVKEAGNDLDETAIKIYKEGSALKTKYTVQALGPKLQPSPAQLKQIMAVRLMELQPWPVASSKQGLKAVNGGKQAQADADESGNFGEDNAGPY